MDLKIIQSLCNGDNDLINESVVICLEKGIDEKKSVELARKKFRNEYYDKKYNYVEPILNDEGEDLRDNYIFVDKGEEETFKRIDDDLVERGKKLCETAGLLGNLSSLMKLNHFYFNKAYMFSEKDTFQTLNKNVKSYFSSFIYKKSYKKNPLNVCHQKLTRLKKGM